MFSNRNEWNDWNEYQPTRTKTRVKFTDQTQEDITDYASMDAIRDLAECVSVIVSDGKWPPTELIHGAEPDEACVEMGIFGISDRCFEFYVYEQCDEDRSKCVWMVFDYIAKTDLVLLLAVMTGESAFDSTRQPSSLNGQVSAAMIEARRTMSRCYPWDGCVGSVRDE